MVVRAGIELATTCLEGRCSIRLSYRTVCVMMSYNITSLGRFFKESAADASRFAVLRCKIDAPYRACPPETLITCPVSIFACSPAKNRMVSAISSGWISFPIGINGTTAFSSSVSIHPV